jgi:hypothetical protein
MDAYLAKQVRSASAWALNLLLIAFLFTFSNAFALDRVLINKDTVIDKSISFNNVILDLDEGRFTVNTGGSLSIENSVINVTISPNNPYLIKLLDGTLILKNTVINVKAENLPQVPDSFSAYTVIDIYKGNVNVSQNQANIDTPFSVAFLNSDWTNAAPTNNMKVNDNVIKNFHGGIGLIFAAHAKINNNKLSNVSNYAILEQNSTAGDITNNIIDFAGNFVSGNAIWLLNDDGISVVNNIIASTAKWPSLQIDAVSNSVFKNNKITDGEDFAISIGPNGAVAKARLQQLISRNKLLKDKHQDTWNHNLSFSNNYMSQNRYGLTAALVDGLTVTKNIFIQKFSNNVNRQFWTNNANLITSTGAYLWTDNIYKEAFTQEVPGDNSKALQFVEFPATGGVVLP